MDSMSKNWRKPRTIPLNDHLGHVAFHRFHETNKLYRKVVGPAAVEQPIVAKVNDLLKNLEDQLRLPCDAYKARGLATELKGWVWISITSPNQVVRAWCLVKQKTLELLPDFAVMVLQDQVALVVWRLAHYQMLADDAEDAAYAVYICLHPSFTAAYLTT